MSYVWGCSWRGVGMCLGWCRCTYGCSGMCLGWWCREGPPEGTIPAKSLPRKHHVAIKPIHAATVARGVVPQRVDWRLGKEWSGCALREAEWGVHTPFTLHPAPLPPRSPQVVMIYSADCAWPLLPIRCTHRPRLARRVLRRAASSWLCLSWHTSVRFHPIHLWMVDWATFPRPIRSTLRPPDVHTECCAEPSFVPSHCHPFRPC
jgi:hypothetical protein